MYIKLTSENKYFLSFGFVVFFLVIREAVFIPLTHDEYSTIMVSYQSVWDIFTFKDPIPNNHILNTLLLKLNVVTFGDHLFTNRIHNVLSFIPFFLFTVLVAKRLSINFTIQVLFVNSIVLQPFLLDFFSITRGYCLSITFQMASLYFAFLFLQKKSTKSLRWSLIIAALGVIANFTLLNFYLPLCGVLFFYAIRFYKKDKDFNIFIVIKNLLIISLILGLSCFIPFSKMMSTNQFVFWNSNNFFHDTIVPLLHSLRAGVFYFRWSNEEYAWVLIGLIFLLLVITFIAKLKGVENQENHLFSLVILFAVILYNNAQFYIANVPFLNARTSLFLVPLLGLLLVTILEYISQYLPKTGKVVTLIFIILTLQHFVRGYNGRANYEWYFNQNTYEILDDIMYEINVNNLKKPVKLDCHWFHHPSLTYHVNKDYRGVIELMPYHKETSPNTEAVYYLSEPNEEKELSTNFTKIKQYNGGHGVLWRRK